MGKGRSMQDGAEITQNCFELKWVKTGKYVGISKKFYRLSNAGWYWNYPKVL
jgi:hypothetical protein